MYAIIYKYGEDDFEIWFPDIPEDSPIEAAFDEFRLSGYSVRGSKNDIKEEL